MNFAAVRFLDRYSTHIYGKAMEGPVNFALLACQIEIIGMVAYETQSAKNAGCIAIKEMTLLKITNSHFEVFI